MASRGQPLLSSLRGEYNQEAGEGQSVIMPSSRSSQDDISQDHNGLKMVSGKKSNYDPCL